MYLSFSQRILPQHLTHRELVIFAKIRTDSVVAVKQNKLYIGGIFEGFFNLIFQYSPALK